MHQQQGVNRGTVGQQAIAQSPGTADDLCRYKNERIEERRELHADDLATQGPTFIPLLLRAIGAYHHAAPELQRPC